MSPIIGSGLTAPFLKMFGADKPVKTDVVPTPIRAEDTVSLSPESVALHESIAQNQEASRSTLSDADPLDSQALAFLASLTSGKGGVANIVG